MLFFLVALFWLFCWLPYLGLIFWVAACLSFFLSSLCWVFSCCTCFVVALFALFGFTILGILLVALFWDSFWVAPVLTLLG